MATPAVNEIEHEFALLSPDAQLSLLERLENQARFAVAGHQDTWETDLAAMSNDPEVQRELSRIHAEFSGTEPDGLKR